MPLDYYYLGEVSEWSRKISEYSPCPILIKVQNQFIVIILCIFASLQMKNGGTHNCLDTMSRKSGEDVGLSYCHGLGGNQVSGSQR